MLKPLLQILFASTLLTGIASAAPITFDLQNVTFDDGTAVTGSFAFDPTTKIYTDFDIATSAASPIPTFTFTPTDSYSYPFLSPSTLLLFSDASFPDPDASQPEKLYLELSFDSPLSASGTPDALTLGLNKSQECLDCVPYRLVTGGSVVAAPTPEPSGIALFATGLLGVAGVVRKRIV